MALAIEQARICDLTFPKTSPRVHSRKQLAKLSASIQAYGLLVPVLITDQAEIICGQARVEAAKLIGMEVVPVIRASHLSSAQVRAYRIADNRLAELGAWDPEVLAAEFQDLIELDFDLALTGFEIEQVDQFIFDAEAAALKASSGPANVIPAPATSAVTRPGDMWQLGNHRLLCGDSLEGASYEALMAGEKADMVFTDPPYNCAIDGFVGGKGKVKHREFAMASGEMTHEAFAGFLTTALEQITHVCRDGAILFACMDWRNIQRLISAGEGLGLDLKNLIVWVKTNGGQGSFYRSKHELVAAFKVGEAAHTNNFGLGETGRYRTNVWEYAGVNTFKAARLDELGMHPTVKPVELVKDAILDVSRRGETVLDPFGGSGTTLIAAQASGRKARLIELDPLYCDVICRRWQAFTGKPAVRAADGATFDDVDHAPATAEAVA